LVSPDDQQAPEEPQPAEPQHLASGLLYRLAWNFYLLLAIVAVVWVGLRAGSIPLSLFVRWPGAIVDVGLGVAAGLALVGLWALGRRSLASARDFEDELRRLLGRLEPAEALGLALLSGFAEELFFRGAVQQAFGWIVATILFAALHLGSGKGFRLLALFAAIGGLVFSGLVIWRQSLLSAMVAHIVVNGINLRHLTRTVEVDS
jgi:membrane protease YdiL (CAAX protease family)